MEKNLKIVKDLNFSVYFEGKILTVKLQDF